MSIVNKRELTELLECDRSTITTWQKKGLPMLVDGNNGVENKYNTRAVIDWMIKKEVTRAIGDGPSLDGGYLDSDQELARLRCAQANKVEIEVALLEGRTLDANDVQLAFGKLDSEVKASFLSMASRLAPVLIKIRSVKEMTQAIKADVLQTLGKLSGSDAGTINESPPGET